MMNRLIEKINRHVPNYFRNRAISTNMLELLYSLLYHIDVHFRKELCQAISFYSDKNADVDKRMLCRDMIGEFTRAWVTPIEYAGFDLLNKTSDERRTYIPDYEEISICKWGHGHNTLPDSKFERYIMFSEYFRRKVLCIFSDSDVSESDYSDFIRDLKDIVVKPLKGTKGYGIQIVNSKSVWNLSEFKSRFREEYLVEEAITQGDGLRRFHPSSVNTVRFVTGINHKGNFHNLFALLRVGFGNSVVDNVSSGGLVALIDGGKSAPMHFVELIASVPIQIQTSNSLAL